jgi:hypothetical protein
VLVLDILGSQFTQYFGEVFAAHAQGDSLNGIGLGMALLAVQHGGKVFYLPPGQFFPDFMMTAAEASGHQQ